MGADSKGDIRLGSRLLVVARAQKEAEVHRGAMGGNTWGGT